MAPVALYKLPTAKATLNQPAIGPTPGMPRSWQAGRSVYGGTVNLASGNLLLSHHIAGWKCKGFAISFGFYFNSQSTDSSSVGAKWSHSYDWKVSGTNPAVVTSGDGTKTSFALGPNGYEAPAGIHEDIVHNANGTWTLKFQGGSEFRFDSDGKLTQQVDSNGNTTNLAYANGLLSTVTDAANRTLTLGYRRA